ncbi:MAG: Zn-ribbon domain-containing OB-fold protein [Haloferacaceae archaeon]
MSDEGFDEWLAAIGEGEAFYLECDEGHGSLPPRRICPHCGSFELTETPLPASGTVETFTTVYVGTPDFTDEEPYVTAIADFGPVRLTGVLRDVDPDEAAVGMTVEPDVGENASTGDSLLVFRPR